MPKVLLDTNVFIWLGENPEKISINAAASIYSEMELFLSAASIWEMAIKIKTDKLRLGFELEEFVNANASKHSISILPIFLDAIFKTLELELIHRDPFDRLIISQAMYKIFPSLAVILFLMLTLLNEFGK